MKPKLVMALPCFNEAKNIVPLIDEYQKFYNLWKANIDLEVIIINDYSTDNTEDVLSTLNPTFSLTKIKHSENRGLTGGINTAFLEFKKRLTDPTCLAFALMDGDNSHKPAQLMQMLTKILEGYDVVIASRYQNGSRIYGVVWWRQILSLGLALIFKGLRNIPGVWDYSCGYRLYSPRIVDRVTKQYGEEVVKEKSFASMVEILVKCHLMGAICAEVPFMLRYDLKLGESKMPFKKTILGNLKLFKTLKKEM